MSGNQLQLQQKLIDSIDGRVRFPRQLLRELFPLELYIFYLEARRLLHCQQRPLLHGLLCLIPVDAQVEFSMIEISLSFPEHFVEVLLVQVESREKLAVFYTVRPRLTVSHHELQLIFDSLGQRHGICHIGHSFLQVGTCLVHSRLEFLDSLNDFALLLLGQLVRITLQLHF